MIREMCQVHMLLLSLHIHGYGSCVCDDNCSETLDLTCMLRLACIMPCSSQSMCIILIISSHLHCCTCIAVLDTHSACSVLDIQYISTVYIVDMQDGIYMCQSVSHSASDVESQHLAQSHPALDTSTLPHTLSEHNPQPRLMHCTLNISSNAGHMRTACTT